MCAPLNSSASDSKTWSHAEIPLGTFSSWRWSPIFGACFIVLPTSGSRRRRPRSAGSSQTNPSRAPPAPGVPAESPLAQMSPLRVTILPPRVTSDPFAGVSLRNSFEAAEPQLNPLHLKPPPSVHYVSYVNWETIRTDASALSSHLRLTASKVCASKAIS